jgi:hypothetical protein
MKTKNARFWIINADGDPVKLTLAPGESLTRQSGGPQRRPRPGAHTMNAEALARLYAEFRRRGCTAAQAHAAARFVIRNRSALRHQHGEINFETLDTWARSARTWSPTETARFARP